MNKCWYAVLTRGGYEHQVATTLRQKIRERGLEEAFGEIMVPTTKGIEGVRGKQRTVERRLFPGYLLVQMALATETWHLVHYLPKVVRFVGESDTTPTPIPAEEVQAVMRQVETGMTAFRTKTFLTVGTKVKIVQGPFRDFTGTIEGVKHHRSRLRVTVHVFGQPITVELDFLQVEAL